MLEKPDQCPCCGRVSRDWQDESSKELTDEGTKAVQNTSFDRTAKYREWHRTLGSGAFVYDVDQIEWRVVNGAMTPVALIELSRIDGDRSIPDSYRDAVWERFSKRDGHDKISAYVAASLGVPACFVLFRHDLSEFHVREIYHPVRDADGYWHPLTQDGYREWIFKLGMGDE